MWRRLVGSVLPKVLTEDGAGAPEGSEGAVLAGYGAKTIRPLRSVEQNVLQLEQGCPLCTGQRPKC